MVGYVENTPKGIFRTYEISVAEINYWNFGGEYLYSAAELEAEALLNNKWNVDVNIGRTGKTLNTDLLRGGPGVYTHAVTEQDYRISTDEARKLSFSLGYEYSFSDDKVSHRHEFGPHIFWKATTSLDLSTEFFITKGASDLQYIENDDLDEQGGFLLGRLDRKTYEITFRFNYAISPDLTIQYYGSPYISMGQYSAFKTLADPDAKDPGDVFHTFTSDEIAYDSDKRTYYLYEEDNPEPVFSFANPDFNFREFRSNLVLRWEYRLGSVIYLVWTHNRNSSEDITNDDLGYNFSSLFKEPAQNIFLIKFSYWFSL
jgi:hypothetical protein